MWHSALRALVALASSRCVVEQSILSSVVLKPPNRKSGHLRCMLHHILSIMSQKAAFSSCTFGAYTFSSASSSSSSHLIFRVAAQPGRSSCIM